MSRLCLKAITDTRKTQIISRGREQIAAAILWDYKKDDNKLAVHVTVNWKKGNTRPTVQVLYGDKVIIL